MEPPSTGVYHRRGMVRGIHAMLWAAVLQPLGACRTWDVESENRPQRGQFLPDLQPHSGAMGQKDGEKWIAAADLQPTFPKSDRLLDIAYGAGTPH